MGDLGSIGKALTPLVWGMGAVLLVPYIVWYGYLRRAADHKAPYLSRSIAPIVFSTLGYVWLVISTIYENRIPGNLELGAWYLITVFFSGGYLLCGSVLANAREIAPRTRLVLSIFLFMAWCIPYVTYFGQALGPRHDYGQAEDERKRLLRILDADSVFHPLMEKPDDFRDQGVVGVSGFVEYTGHLIEIRAVIKSREDAVKVRRLIEEAAPRFPVACQVQIREHSEIIQFAVPATR